MNRPPRLIFRQVGIIMVMLSTAVVAGIVIGWLLSSERTRRIAQEPNSTLGASAHLANISLWSSW